jgi:hypothetical protein
LPSLHTVGVPGWQAPPLHASPEVQALPSSHTLVLAAWTQPVVGLQLSSVQTLPSSQAVGPPDWQAPPTQTSPVVQASPSLHAALLFAKPQTPVCGSQLSSVHTLLSLQTVGVPGWHAPPPQTSPDVHALPSSHTLVLLAWTHPVAGLQLSSVQALLSSQTVGPPD